MKFTIEKESLLTGLSKIQSIAEKKATLPALSFVLFEAKDTSLILTATDMEVGIRVSLSAHIGLVGKMALPAKKLYDVVREFPNSEISFDIKENFSIKISHKNIIFNLIGLDPDQFPSFPSIKEENLFSINSSILKRMIDRTFFAMSNDESKYNLNGIFFHKISLNDFIYIAAISTDIHRLAFSKEIFENLGDSFLEKGVIIPKKGIMEIRKLIDNTENEIQMGFSGNNAIFTKENTKIIIRVIDGDFPEYQKVIPQMLDSYISIPQDSFLKVLRRISTLTNERHRGIRLTFSSQRLEVSAKNPELGEAKEEIPIEYEGEEISIAYNARYLIDAVMAYPTEFIQFQFKDNISPTVITPGENQNSFAVIMPMRL